MRLALREEAGTTKESWNSRLCSTERGAQPRLLCWAPPPLPEAPSGAGAHGNRMSARAKRACADAWASAAPPIKRRAACTGAPDRSHRVSATRGRFGNRPGGHHAAHPASPGKKRCETSRASAHAPRGECGGHCFSAASGSTPTAAVRDQSHAAPRSLHAICNSEALHTPRSCVTRGQSGL